MINSSSWNLRVTKIRKYLIAFSRITFVCMTMITSIRSRLFSSSLAFLVWIVVVFDIFLHNVSFSNNYSRQFEICWRHREIKKFLRSCFFDRSFHDLDLNFCLCLEIHCYVCEIWLFSEYIWNSKSHLLWECYENCFDVWSMFFWFFQKSILFVSHDAQFFQILDEKQFQLFNDLSRSWCTSVRLQRNARIESSSTTECEIASSIDLHKRLISRSFDENVALNSWVSKSRQWFLNALNWATFEDSQRISLISRY